jgi:hypothetical protein
MAAVKLGGRVTGGDRNDVTQLIPLVERIPPLRGGCRPAARAT